MCCGRRGHISRNTPALNSSARCGQPEPPVHSRLAGLERGSSSATVTDVHPELADQLDLSTVATREDVLRTHPPHELRAMLARGELTRVWRGIYCTGGGAPHLTTQLRGLDLALGEPVIACGPSAAELMGFVVDRSSLVHIAVPVPRALADRAGVRVHRGELGLLSTMAGRACTSPAPTAVDLARTRSRPRALATLDAALRSGYVSLPELRDAVRTRRAHRGIAVLRPLVELADGLAESPMESETRLLLHDAGLPRPVLQHALRDQFGGFVARFDLAWPWARVAVEYDGVEFHSDRTSLRRDRRRAGDVLAQGWRCLSLTAADIHDTPARTMSRVAQLLADRAPS